MSNPHHSPVYSIYMGEGGEEGFKGNTMIGAKLMYYVHYVLCRLGQACNHIAAVFFFIDCHANDEELPSELSKTLQPMAWHQPPKKIVSPECARNMKFVKPSHGDTPRSETQEISEIKRSSFDPRLPEHRIEIDQKHLHLLLTELCTQYRPTAVLV